MLENIELNRNSVNKKIKAKILSDNEMRDIGFTDYDKNNWYFMRMLKYKNRNIEISFSVTIPKDASDIRIDVLDEDFLQPYDYQRYLKNNPNHEISLHTKEQVEELMDYLQEKGVLSGHIRGEYI